MPFNTLSSVKLYIGDNVIETQRGWLIPRTNKFFYQDVLPDVVFTVSGYPQYSHLPNETGAKNGFNVIPLSINVGYPSPTSSVKIVIPDKPDLIGKEVFIQVKIPASMTTPVSPWGYWQLNIRAKILNERSPFDEWDGIGTSPAPSPPVPFNITSTSASMSCPSVLKEDFVHYLPQVFTPGLNSWTTFSEECYGGEVVTARGLTKNTSGYKFRFIGVYSPEMGDGEVEGAASAAFNTKSDDAGVPCAPYGIGKNISTDYKKMLAGSPATRVLLLKIVRNDGVVFGLCTGSSDIDGDLITRDGVNIPELQGVIFKAKGVTPTNIENNSSIDSPSNLEVTTLLSSGEIEASDLAAGAFDGAQITLCEANYEDLSQGVMKLQKGYIGDVSFDNQEFSSELVSLADKLSSKILDVVGTLCRAKRLGDHQCKVDLSSNTTDGFAIRKIVTITAVDEDEPRRVFTLSDISAVPNGHYLYGTLRVVDENSKNLNAIEKIKFHNNSVIGLSAPYLFEMSVGDEVEIIMGCDRRIHTCTQRFNNAVNFRGEPRIPGVAIYDVNK